MTNVEKRAYYNLLPRDALAHDIMDARNIYMQDGLYTPEIRNGLQQMIRDSKSLYPNLFGK